MLLRLAGIYCVTCVALLVSGCGGGLGEMRENRDPLVQRARSFKKGGEIDAAIKTYNQALDRRGDMPQTHFELAAIYLQDKKDYVSAIYHYQRYLDLNPDTKKTNLVHAEIRRARMEYAASLPDRPSDAVQTIAAMAKERDVLKARITDVQQENETLKKEREASRQRIAKLEDYVLRNGGKATLASLFQTNSTAQSGSPRQVVATPPANMPPLGPVAGPAPVQQSAGEMYEVKPGDTLAKIAREHYRDATMVGVIFEANKNTMKTERDLRVGQKIILPAKKQNKGG